MLKRILVSALALALALTGWALAEVRELSGCYGQDIAAAAEEIGGLARTEGDEFPDNYEGAGLALRGDGVVRLIDLQAPAADGGADYALCGVTLGMAHADVSAHLAGYSLLWDYDEEAAFMIIPDEQDRVNSQMLVVFFDDAGRVSGAWYRSSEA